MSTIESLPQHDPALDAILDRPDLPNIVGSLSGLLDRERAARLRFREELTPEEKAEFICGEKIVHSPARAAHLRATIRLAGFLRSYVSINKLGEVFTEKALICLTRNDYEPDIVFFDSETAAEFTDSQMEFPAPDFAVEVLSPSTEKRDRGVKFTDYANHTVTEYWIIDTDAESVEQYIRSEETGAYELAVKLKSGQLDCVAITGLSVAVEAIFDDDANAEAVRAILG